MCEPWPVTEDLLPHTEGSRDPPNPCHALTTIDSSEGGQKNKRFKSFLRTDLNTQINVKNQVKLLPGIIAIIKL